MLGRYSNHSEQGERIAAMLELVASGPSGPVPRTTKRVCRRLTEAEIADLVACYAGGLPIDRLVERFQVNQSTVQKHVRQHELPRRSERLGSRHQEEAIRLYETGRSTESIARELDRGATSVRRALARAGVTLRPRGRPVAQVRR